MSYAKPLFSINSYDSDGDITEKGVFLHFGDTAIKVAGSLAEFDEFIGTLGDTRREIADNYYNF